MKQRYKIGDVFAVGKYIGDNIITIIREEGEMVYFTYLHSKARMKITDMNNLIGQGELQLISRAPTYKSKRFIKYKKMKIRS